MSKIYHKYFDNIRNNSIKNWYRIFTYLPVMCYFYATSHKANGCGPRQCQVFHHIYAAHTNKPVSQDTDDPRPGACHPNLHSPVDSDHPHYT